MARNTLRGSAQPSLKASCGHEDPGVPARAPAGRAQQTCCKSPGQSSPEAGWTRTPNEGLRWTLKMPQLDLRWGKFRSTCSGFVPRRTRFSEQNRAGSSAGRNTAQSQEGAGWGLLNVRVGSCLYVDRGFHDFHLLRAGREPLLARRGASRAEEG